MTTGATGQLGLALPVQGELSGTWGDTVNNGITQYTNIAIAGTLTLTNDGAVTLANTTGDASASNITSSLTGAGTVTAQFAIVRVTGTLTTAKVVTAPSYSKTYTVVNAATGGIVTFKASGQTGVSIAVGETAFVYFNGTDYVKVVGTATAGAAGGSNTQVQFNSSGVLAGSANMTFNGTTLTVNDLTDSSLTAGRVTFAGTAGNLTDSANLTWNGSTLAVTGAFSATTTIAAGGAIKSTGANLVNEASAIKISQEGVSTSSIFAYGANASTTGVLQLVTKSSDGSVQVVAGSLAYASGLSLTHVLATAYSGSNAATWTNGLTLYNSATPATGVANLINFTGSSNVNTVFGVAQNASGYGDFVWAGYNGSFTELGRFTSAGYLGLGTASPISILNASFAGGAVSGTHSMAFGFPYAANLQLKSTNAGTSVAVASVGLYGNPERTKEFAFFNQADDSRSGYLGYQYGSGGVITNLGLFNALAGALTFSTNNAEVGRFSSAGYFGIGTNNPQVNLQVNGTAVVLRLEETTTGGSKRLEMGVTSGGQAYVGANQSSQSLIFQTVGTNRVTIAANGDVSAAGNNLTLVGTSPTLTIQDNSSANNSRLLLQATATALYIGGTYSGSNIPTIFTRAGTTTGSESARFDTSGNFLVGTNITKDILTVSNGISMVGGGAGSAENYSGTDTRTWASSYVASSGTQTLCRIASPNGSFTGGGLVRVTTSYQYRGGNPGNNYAQYMVTTNTTATANLIFSAGTYPTITVTTVGSGSTATLDVIVNYSGDSHVQVVVEVFGKVVSWSI